MTDRELAGPLYAAASALPHLSGLAQLVQASHDTRIATAGITASGRLLVNPQWFATLAFREKVFVLAHEMMHLALRSHERCSGVDARLFNVAHDFIINDMLANALDMAVPADGLYQRGASASSAERIVTEIRRDEAAGSPVRHAVWCARARPVGALGAALAAAGLAPEGLAQSRPEGDVLDAAAERWLFPDRQADPVLSARIAAAGERAVALDVWMRRTQQAFDAQDEAAAGALAVRHSTLWEVLAGYHAPPWEAAVQRWFDDVTPSGRTYTRCSRRQGTRWDVVLPGRAREGWTITVVLDTSGSMYFDYRGGSPLSRALGSLKSFCLSANVSRVRIVQADVGTEADDTVDARDLDQFQIIGGGGSDMEPSMRMLAGEPEVEAVIVITDGSIAYPTEPMPYTVLWALTEACDGFAPGYGRIVVLDR